jgi:hypothetical protein
MCLLGYASHDCDGFLRVATKNYDGFHESINHDCDGSYGIATKDCDGFIAFAYKDCEINELNSSKDYIIEPRLVEQQP